MKSKTITMYELIGLIKDGKAPKKICYQDNYLEFDGEDYKYYEGADTLSDDSLVKYIAVGNLKDTVEILPEENEMIEMKEMIYQKYRKIEILYHGFYKDYEFYIMNLGTHPTAYVNVYNNKLLNGKNYDNIDINVHGGLTYSEDELYINDEKEKVKGWFIGWDYAHYNDYAGYEMDMPEEIRSNSKKWTTEEIFEDVKKVIEQCINYKENDEWKDIEELNNNFTFEDTICELTDNDYKISCLSKKINKLIKNQRKIIERLESKDE